MSVAVILYRGDTTNRECAAGHSDTTRSQVGVLYPKNSTPSIGAVSLGRVLLLLPRLLLGVSLHRLLVPVVAPRLAPLGSGRAVLGAKRPRVPRLAAVPRRVVEGAWRLGRRRDACEVRPAGHASARRWQILGDGACELVAAVADAGRSDRADCGILRVQESELAQLGGDGATELVVLEVQARQLRELTELRWKTSGDMIPLQLPVQVQLCRVTICACSYLS